MAESKRRTDAVDFAVAILKFCEPIKGHHALVNQLELFVKAEIANRDQAAELYTRCGSLRRMLIASINTAGYVDELCQVGNRGHICVCL